MTEYFISATDFSQPKAEAEAHSEMGLLNYTNVGSGVVDCRPVPGCADKYFLVFPSLSGNEIHK